MGKSPSTKHPFPSLQKQNKALGTLCWSCCMCTWCWDVGMKGLRARENENLALSTPHHHLGKASVVPGWQSIKKYSGFHLPCHGEGFW